MAYCSWATGVNKIILDSTTISAGNNAAVSDELESGGIAKRRLICSNPPDTYSVVMSFDFVTPVRNGYTELELFYAWYKHVHKFGTVPFQFPAILINSNRQAGYSQEEIGYLLNRRKNAGETITEDDIPDHEYYKITSAVEGSKSGNSLEIRMTWETYATGTIQVEDESFEVDRIVPSNGSVEVVMSIAPSYEPNSATWTVYYKTAETEPAALTITNILYDGDRTAVLFFDKFKPEVTTEYTLILEDKEESFVAEGTNG